MLTEEVDMDMEEVEAGAELLFITRQATLEVTLKPTEVGAGK